MIHAEAFQDAVAATLTRNDGSASRCFLVIDQAALRGVNVVRELKWSTSPIDLMTQGPVDWAHGASPVLLPAPSKADLGQFQLEAWHRLAHRWRFANALTVLVSDLTADELTRALATRMHWTLQGDMRVMLRWFDGRVLDALESVLDASQSNAFFEPCEEWYWQARDGTARMKRRNRDVLTASFEDQHSLTQEQETALVAFAEADSIVDALLSQGNSDLSSLTPPVQHERVSGLLRNSRAYDLQQLPDQVAYCSLGLSLGDDFHCEEPWSDLLAESAQTGKRFSDLLAHLAKSEDRLDAMS